MDTTLFEDDDFFTTTFNSIPDDVYSSITSSSPNITSAVPSNLGFRDSLVQGITTILVTELGDKTFFLAAILAMRHTKLIVFAGAMSALILMTVVSTLLGYGITALIPPVYTFYASVALMFFFGFKMFWDAYRMKPSEADNIQREVEDQLGNKHDLEDMADDKERMSSEESTFIEVGTGTPIKEENAAKRLVTNLFNSVQLRKNVPKPQEEKQQVANERTSVIESDVDQLDGRAKYISWLKILLKTFGLIFLAEWGDRSQLATIVLASVNNVAGITVGAVIGHFTCTTLAVIAGSLISAWISVRAVTVIGGIVFIGFAIATLVIGLDDSQLQV